ncbi:MAG: alkaline phosphatase PhoX [Ignavibacteria bacterium]
MKKLILSLLLVFIFTGISSSQTYPFNAMDTNFTTNYLLVPQSYQFSLIFQQNQPVLVGNGPSYPARGVNDYIVYIPNNGSSTNGWLFVSHETTDSNTFLGDGGGATTFPVTRVGNSWFPTGPFKHMNFAPIGGTLNNCAGSSAILANGNVMTAEEFAPASNSAIFNNGAGIRDTNDFGGYKKYLNYGWMVECNVQGDTALRKSFQMGRYSHEAALVMPDGRTLYLTDDNSGGCFFKFVANTFGNYETGQLFAYKQVGSSGTWLTMPMVRDSLNNARDVAQRLGATIFNRLEDIEMDANGTIYIAETGADSVNLSSAINNGGVVANHLVPLYVGNNRYDDPYGRVLKFDPISLGMTVLIQGGTAADGKTNFASVDNLAIDKARNIIYLQEDLINSTRGRQPSFITSSSAYICEVYALSLTVQNPTVNDLKRFAIFPKGSEATGGYFTPDFNTFFINVQHPSSGNGAPFNVSTTVAITGFPSLTGVNGEAGTMPSRFEIKQNYPNPFNPSTTIKFAVPKDGDVKIKVYDVKGQLVKTLVNQRIIVGNYSVDFNASDLSSGIYFYTLETPEFKETKKMVLVK